MEIETLYVYPIKSMRGVSVPSAKLTATGFPHDRRFMVLQPAKDDNGEQTFKNISIAPNNELVRFWQAIDSKTVTLTVTHKPADGGESSSIDIPLEPDTSDLDVVNIMMHTSPTPAYKMPSNVNTWFSSCLGFECILAFIGEHRREVKMSNLGWTPSSNTNETTNNANSWLSTITSAASAATSLITGNGGSNTTSTTPSSIGFADVAPYLIASSKSMDSVRSRLPPAEAEAYDIVKFRPNIVVSGATAVWEEDFWGELTLPGDGIKLELAHNCARCRSINIDYETGAQGKGEAGSMLKKLSKDRRVDAGAKWSPVFGRYAFLAKEFEGVEVRVGEEVVVSRVNGERTAFDWKGLSTLPGDGKD